MAINIGELIAKITTDTGDFRAGLDRVDGEVRKLSSRVKTAGRNLQIGLTVPITRLATASVKTATSLNVLRRGMVAIKGSTAAARREIAKFQRTAGDFRAGLDQVGEEVGKLDSRLGTVGRRLTVGLTLPIVGVAAASVKAATTLDSLRRGMVAMTGSAAAADREIAKLQESAKLPGLGFRQVIQGSVRLQAAGASADDARRSMEAFGNAIALVGGGKADLDLVTLALGQILTSGQVLGQEIRQLQQRVPQIRQAMIEAFGTARSEEIQALGVSSEEFLQKINTVLLRLPRITSGIRNSFENLGDSVFRLGAAIGDTLVPVVEPLVNRLADLSEIIANLSPTTQRWVVGLGAMLALLGPLLLGFSALTTGIVAFKAAILLGLGGQIAVVTLVTTVVGFLGAAFVSLGLDIAAAEKSANDLAEGIAQAGGASTEAAMELQAAADAATAMAQADKEALDRSDDLTQGTLALARALSEKKDALIDSVATQFFASGRSTDDITAFFNAMVAGMEAVREAAEIDRPATPLGAFRATADNIDALIDKQRDLNETVDRLKLELQLTSSAEEAKKLEVQLGNAESQLALLNDGLNTTAGLMARITNSLRDLGRREIDIFGGDEALRERARILAERRRRGGITTFDVRPTDFGARPDVTGGGLGSFLADLGNGLKDTFKRLLDPQLIVANLVSGGLSSLLGAGLDFVGGFIGESPEDRARREASDNLRKALDNLSIRIREVSDALTEQPFGGIGAAISAAFVQTAEDARGPLRRRLGDFLPDDLEGLPTGPLSRINEELAKLGLTMEDVRRIAETLGVPFAMTEEFFRTLGDAIREIDFAQIIDTFVGRLSLLRREFDLLDITDPVEQIQRIREILEGALGGDLLARVQGIDFAGDPTEALRQLLDDLRAGAIDPEELGGLPLAQFLDLLGQLESLGDAANDATDGLNSFSGALRNVPTGFKVALGRFGATTPSGPLGPTEPTGGVTGGPGKFGPMEFEKRPLSPIVIENMTVVANNPDEFMEAMQEQIRREGVRGGPTDIDMAIDPRFI